jgi:thiamine-phosphate diphosphorylase
MAIVDSAAAGRHAADHGATHLLLRMPDAPTRVLWLELTGLLRLGLPQPLLVSDRVDVALAAGAAGVNLPEAGLAVADARSLLGAERLVGRSVHSVEGAAEAAAAGADFLLLGPVFPTPTHPGHPGLGLETLAAAVTAAGPGVAVLAVGGVDRERAGACREAGAAGFAAIRLFQPEPSR